MSAQDKYAINQDIGYPGLLYGNFNNDVVSRAVEKNSIYAGLAVSHGTDKSKDVILGGSEYLGISVRSLNIEGDSADKNKIKWEKKDTIGVLRTGYILAKSSNTCVAGDKVFYMQATGVLGAGSAPAGGKVINSARWESSCDANELAVLSVGVVK